MALDPKCVDKARMLSMILWFWSTVRRLSQWRPPWRGPAFRWMDWSPAWVEREPWWRWKNKFAKLLSAWCPNFLEISCIFWGTEYSPQSSMCHPNSESHVSVVSIVTVVRSELTDGRKLDLISSVIEWHCLRLAPGFNVQAFRSKSDGNFQILWGVRGIWHRFQRPW